MRAGEIILERETANDESALVVAIYALSGTAVEEDALIFDIENSKATQELRAPRAGIVTHELKVGEVVRFGIPLARVAPAGDTHDAGGSAAERHEPRQLVRDGGHPEDLPSVSASREVAESAPMAAARLSRAASALMREKRLTTDGYQIGFITTHDIKARELQVPPPPVEVPLAGPSRTTQPAVRGAASAGTAVGGRKRAEIDVLSNGAGATMLSVLGVTLGAVSMRRPQGDFLDGRITDLVIYEAARLMKKYPKLNAYYSKGELFQHTAINAGMAMDRGGSLVVYGIEDADRLGLPALADQISDAVARYMSGELTTAELSRATFTVTDLSGDELDFVLPLLPHGQSCILGITRSEGAGFRLFAGFDHRVTEGREVSSFLGELAARVRSFADREDAPVEAEARCSTCDRSLQEATAKSRDKGLLRIINRQGQEALCCASCWNGW